MSALRLGLFGRALGGLTRGLTGLGFGLGGLRRFGARRSDVVGAFGGLGGRLALVGRVGLFGGCLFCLSLGNSLFSRCFDGLGLGCLFGDRGGLLGNLVGHLLRFGGRLGGRGLDLFSNHGLGLFLGGSLFLRRSGGLGGFRFLRCALLKAFLGLLARLTFLRIVARRPLLETGRIEEAQDTVRRLRADAQPMLDAVRIELHALGRILRQQRIVGADFLDEAAVARIAAVRHDNAVIGPLLGASTREANCNCHL